MKNRLMFNLRLVFAILFFAMIIVISNNTVFAGLKTIPGFVNSYKHIDRVLHESDFNFLYIGISLDEIIQTVGEPNGLIGSGILSPYYELEDSIIVLCSQSHSFDKLRYAEIVKEDGTSREFKLKNKEEQ